MKRNAEFYTDDIKFVKEKRSKIVNYSEKLDILMLQSNIRLENLKIEKKTSRGRKSKYIELNQRTVNLLNKKRLLYVKWDQFIKNREIKVASFSARLDKLSQLNGFEIIGMLKNFITERRMSRTRTVAKDVMLYFLKQGIFNFCVDHNDQYSAYLEKLRDFKEMGIDEGTRLPM